MTRQPQLVPVVQDGDIIPAEPGLNPRYAVDVDDVASMYAHELTWIEDPAVVPLEQMVESLNRLDGMQEVPTPVIAAWSRIERSLGASAGRRMTKRCSNSLRWSLRRMRSGSTLQSRVSNRKAKY